MLTVLKLPMRGVVRSVIDKVARWNLITIMFLEKSGLVYAADVMVHSGNFATVSIYSKKQFSIWRVIVGKVTGISWTDHTFNPWIGCTKVSEGCKRTSESNWREPFRWAKRAQAAGVRAKVFCASQADVFDAEAPEGAQRDLFNLIHITSDWLDWQILTKRPQNISGALENADAPVDFLLKSKCWLGVSAESQATADQRIPLLLQTPAAVRFISAEPLLGPVTLNYLHFDRTVEIDALKGTHGVLRPHQGTNQRLDWVICGGESGHGARPMNPAWARSLRDQCKVTGTAFFMKQMGSVFGPNKGHELPLDLDIRQFPEVADAR